MGERLEMQLLLDNAEGYWEDGEIVAAYEAMLLRRFGAPSLVWSFEILAPGLSPQTLPKGARLPT
jgi:hypothetical protein